MCVCLCVYDGVDLACCITLCVDVFLFAFACVRGRGRGRGHVRVHVRVRVRVRVYVHVIRVDLVYCIAIYGGYMNKYIYTCIHVHSACRRSTQQIPSTTKKHEKETTREYYTSIYYKYVHTLMIYLCIYIHVRAYAGTAPAGVPHNEYPAQSSKHCSRQICESYPKTLVLKCLEAYAHGKPSPAMAVHPEFFCEFCPSIQIDLLRKSVV